MSSPSIADIKRTLREHLSDLRQRYGVRSFALFGSYVRGEQAPESDIDILVTFNETPGLLAFIDLEDELSDLLGRPVDLVVEDSLKPRIGERVKREVEPI
jgi:predicted nucleotidyltransferase